MFPDFFRASGLPALRYHVIFDLLIAAGLALATSSVGVMAAFGLVFVPSMIAYRIGPSWKASVAIAAGFSLGAYLVAFAAALVIRSAFRAGFGDHPRRTCDVRLARVACAPAASSEDRHGTKLGVCTLEAPSGPRRAGNLSSYHLASALVFHPHPEAIAAVHLLLRSRSVGVARLRVECHLSLSDRNAVLWVFVAKIDVEQRGSIPVWDRQCRA